MAKKRIDGYEVSVNHFETPAERKAFLDKWLSENQIPNGLRTEKGLYMGRDAVFVYKNYDTVMVATI